MATRGIIFFFLSAIFYMMAMAFAFAAEYRRSTVAIQQDESLSYCIHSKSGVTALAIVAFVLLFLAQGMMMGARWCWGSNPSLDRGEHRVAFTLLFGFSWFSFVISETVLLVGTIMNSRPTKGAHHCSKLQNRAFSFAGASTVLTLILSAAYFGFSYMLRDESSIHSSVEIT